jgi:hypothetical protein
VISGGAALIPASGELRRLRADNVIDETESSPLVRPDV